MDKLPTRGQRAPAVGLVSRYAQAGGAKGTDSRRCRLGRNAQWGRPDMLQLDVGIGGYVSSWRLYVSRSYNHRCILEPYLYRKDAPLCPIVDT